VLTLSPSSTSHGLFVAIAPTLPLRIDSLPFLPSYPSAFFPFVGIAPSFRLLASPPLPSPPPHLVPYLLGCILLLPVVSSSLTPPRCVLFPPLIALLVSLECIALLALRCCLAPFFLFLIESSSSSFSFSLQVKGFEPLTRAWKALMIPLHQTCISPACDWT
jgi:hypothetical protein